MDDKWIIGSDDPVLVTGANGFIGARVVATLLEYGFSDIRCFVRPSSNLTRLQQVVDRNNANERITLVKGDLLAPADCARAAEDVRVVFHLAAGFDKSFAGAFMNSALATRNLLEALCSTDLIRRFVNVSSFSVYSNLGMKRGALLDESAPLETSHQERQDAYGFGKLKQEEVVRRYEQERGVPFVILRPGTVFGPGKTDLTGRIGIDTFGFFIHIGGSNQLPLTFVDNCAEAIVLAGLVPGVEGEVFNVVDDDLLTSQEFLRAYRKKRGRFFSLPMPYFVASALCKGWEGYSNWSAGQLPAAFNKRRCAAEWQGNSFTNAKLRKRLGWSPRVPMDDAIAAFLSQFDAEGRS